MLKYALPSIFILLLGERNAADVTARVACSSATPQFQCSSDCKHYGYCDGSNLVPSFSCPDGQLCVNDVCGPYTSCPGITTDANGQVCNVPSLKMPDIDDPNCQKYYICNAKTNFEFGYGELNSCSANEIFDPCTGQCIIGTRASTYSRCDGTQSVTHILQNNIRLAYTCTTTTPSTTIWTACYNGYYILSGTSSADCHTDVNYNGCPNGKNGDDDDGDDDDGNDDDGNDDDGNDDDGNDDGGGNDNGNDKCTPGTKYEVTGNNCVYDICSADYELLRYRCGSGYHYVDASQKCVAGSCNAGN